MAVNRPNEIESSIRLATLKEVDAFLTHVWKTVYQGGNLPGLLDCHRLPYCDEFIVAESDGEIIGMITLAGLKNKRPPTLDALYVLPTYRGKAVGCRLCEAAIRRFMEAQKTPVFCDVTSKNMHRTIERLPSDLKDLLTPFLSYQAYGDQWEDRN